MGLLFKLIAIANAQEILPIVVRTITIERAINKRRNEQIYKTITKYKAKINIYKGSNIGKINNYFNQMKGLLLRVYCSVELA